MINQFIMSALLSGKTPHLAFGLALAALLFAPALLPAGERI